MACKVVMNPHDLVNTTTANSLVVGSNSSYTFQGCTVSNAPDAFQSWTVRPKGIVSHRGLSGGCGTKADLIRDCW